MPAATDPRVPGDATGSSYDDQLIAGLADERPEVAEICAWVLGQRRVARAVGPLCELVQRRPRDIAVCAAAVEALAQIGDPSAVPALLWVLEEGYAGVRRAAVRALARLDAETARAVLARVAAEDPAAGVRELAVRLLDTLRREDRSG
ncbi:HEAT repeat domain-containing protein [Thermomicrobiaceae bacterium CFH 74404]|uniref:HEAT repeat domain-containing protein n=1 Tax=Thermalbibacter longus TaxID=2951981 RepID=A0AA42BAM9_9BACT|nr:HEAT repeat domain-containing protein [Thermalbibacter longus]MCM8748814.1 HEAT repeat domain-containing protein [Thermalbibacter longus]